jgi:hypothetical protein
LPPQARIADDNVDATLLTREPGDHLAYRTFVRDIGKMTYGRTARIDDLGGHCRDRFVIAATVDHDERAVLSEGERQRPANVLACPRHESYFAGERLVIVLRHIHVSCRGKSDLIRSEDQNNTEHQFSMRCGPSCLLLLLN